MNAFDLKNKNILFESCDAAAFRFALLLDRMRIFFLKLTLKNQTLRQIYSDRAYRLGCTFILLSALYLVISLKWSIVLLVFGPLIFGYPHLVASYRFLQKPESIEKKNWDSSRIFRLFLFLTGVSLLIRFASLSLSWIPQLPYGTWEILLSLVALVILRSKFKSFAQHMVTTLTLLSAALLLKLSWHNPLAIVGFALLIHNWVGFGHWFLASKDLKTRSVVILSTLIFAFIHILVFAGFLDSWISFLDLSFLSTQSFQVSGWVLAPWSNDPMVWNRALVLYSFGLSMHYFIWLRALPQSLDQRVVPNSFRRSLEKLRSDCGAQMTTLLFLGALLILAMWSFLSLAGRIYFGIAMLHGWLELIFLIAAFYSGLLIKKEASQPASGAKEAAL